MDLAEERIKALNEHPVQSGDYVLYWMQSAQRTEDNQALELAASKANSLGQPLLVFFGLTDTFPDANLRHYQFLLEGLKEVDSALRERGIKFVLRMTSPVDGVKQLAQSASLVVTDRGYLRVEKRWRTEVAEVIHCQLLQVETNVVVPVEEASDKEEYAAHTIRKKINKKRDNYITSIPRVEVQNSSLSSEVSGVDVQNSGELLKKLNIDRSVLPVDEYKGGYSEARKRLEEFIERKLEVYSRLSNDPTADCLSHLSPYLHFGQMSPIEIVREVQKINKPGTEDFFEQLIVRRELAMNFVHYNQNYDGPLMNMLPSWAVKTLTEHWDDKREYLYSKEELETAVTHDPYWNAAQQEMVLTGKMHSYMRMYWGKKIFEWTPAPDVGFQWALELNNKYELDGRDANGFAGVAWCFGKHDRAWTERNIFGKVRYMNANGLRRKFRMNDYVNRMNSL